MSSGLLFLVVPVDEQPEGWFRPWTSGAKAAFPGVIELAPDEIERGGFSDEDRFIVSRYFQFAVVLPKLPPNSAVLIEHGTNTPYSVGRGVDISGLNVYESPAIRGVAVTVPSIEAYHRQAMAIPSKIPVKAVGFPYPPKERDVFALGPSHEKRRQMILFPQRIGDDTNPLYAVMVGSALIKKGWEVAFSTPRPIEDRWPWREWEKLGIQIHVTQSKAEYLSLLKQSKAVITTAMAGQLWMSGYEGWLAGCIPLAVGSRVLSFNDPFATRYDALNPIESIKDTIYAWGGLWNKNMVEESWYLPERWAERMRTLLDD